jgi:dUTPase
MYVSSEFCVPHLGLIDTSSQDLEATLRGANGFGSTGGHGAL